MRRGRALPPALFAAVLAAAGVAGAETARVRSGDHGSFTRLVIELAGPADWRFGRTTEGYALSFGRPDVQLRLGDVFRSIGRDRIAGLSQDAEGRLTIALGCEDCHATALSYRDSWIVIDVADGPPPAGSPFEAPLPSAADPADGARNAPVGSPRPRTAPLRPGSGSGVQEGETGPAVAARAPAPEQLPPVRAGHGSVWAAAGLPEPADTSRSMRRSGGSAPADPREASAARRPVWLDPSATLSPPGTARQALPPVTPAEAGSGEEVPATPDAAERDRLLHELARAAAQGLLEADLPALDRARRARETPPSRGDVPPPVATQLPQPEADAAAHVRIEAETSVDRDTRAARRWSGATPEGRACIDDAELDLASWGGAADPWAGLSERRAALLGEFDRPDPAAVLGLARYYLHLGFGAEARAVLEAFGGDLPGAATLSALAALIDGRGAAGAGPFAGQGACPGRAALWATVAEGVPRSGAGVNAKAVTAAFAELPPHLRRLLGPKLARAFLDAGDRDTAIALREATLRAGGSGERAFALFDAALGLAEGEVSAASGLATLAGGGDPAAAEAYAAYLEAELAAGRVPEKGSVTAAALAFEIADTPEGRRLADAALDALLAEGDFDAARQEILRRISAPGGAPADDGGGTAAPSGGEAKTALWWRFADALTRGAPDSEFLRQAFAARDALAESLRGGPVAPAFALRLVGLGFADEALRYLPVDAGGEAAALARAEAQLAAGRAAEAFGTLAGLRGPAVDRLRARALLALGDAHGAAERFSAAGDARMAERAAFQAGAWDHLTGSEDGTLRALARLRVARAQAPLGGRWAGATDAEPDAAQAGATHRAPGAPPPEGEVPTTSPPVSPVSGSPPDAAGSAGEGSGEAATETEQPEEPHAGRVARARAALEAAQVTRSLVEALVARGVSPTAGQ
jgi:hypothetical protein